MIKRAIITGIVAISMCGAVLAKAQPEAKPVEVPILAKTFDLDYPGGTIKSLLAAMEKAIGAKPNIIVDNPETLELACPPAVLRDVSAWSVVLALPAWADFRDNPIIVGPAHPLMKKTDPDTILIIRYRQKVEPLRINAVNIEKHLKKHTIQDINSALTAALRAAGVDPKTVTLEFHAETKVLIVQTPSEEARDTVWQVLSQLEN